MATIDDFLQLDIRYPAYPAAEGDPVHPVLCEVVSPTLFFLKNW